MHHFKQNFKCLFLWYLNSNPKIVPFLYHYQTKLNVKSSIEIFQKIRRKMFQKNLISVYLVSYNIIKNIVWVETMTVPRSIDIYSHQWNLCWVHTSVTQRESRWESVCSGGRGPGIDVVESTQIWFTKILARMWLKVIQD